MKHYQCNICGEFFNLSIGTKSYLVKLTASICPKCNSFEISLTPHGIRQLERISKIKKLNEKEH